MLKVNTKNNTISLTRGDTCYLKLQVLDSEGQPFRLTENEQVSCYFRDMPNTGKLIFRGTIQRNVNEEVTDEAGIVMLHIRPDDTKNCPVQKYYWDAQVKCLDTGDIFTFISGMLKLTDEVTYDDE